jgi:polysaccharide pyruvyl transferase WcaK-like protein
VTHADAEARPTTDASGAVVVAGWVGSSNLGDELVFSALAQQLEARGAAALPISTAPVATAAVHGTGALPHDDPRAWWRALGADGRAVFGGGGLLQDESSRWNVPYHLGRVVALRSRRARLVAVGLGGGRLHRPSMVAIRAALAGVPIGARDRATVRQLTDLGLTAELTADLAFSLRPPVVDVRDELVVSLRPRNVGGGWRPAAGSWRAGLPTEGQLDALAARLRDVARDLGLSLRFVALQADRDGPLHDAIADRVRGVDVASVRPDLSTLAAEVGRGRVVVGMRFHAAVLGLLTGRPVLAAAYSSKVAELAADAPRTVGLLRVPLSRIGPADVRSILAVGDHHRAEELAAWVARERGNGRLLDELLSR